MKKPSRTERPAKNSLDERALIEVAGGVPVVRPPPPGNEFPPNPC